MDGRKLRSDLLPVWENEERERIRAVLRRRVGELGLRPVAREVGMSPTGLRNVLEGTLGHRGTLRKLEAWAKRHEVREPDPAAGQALSALLQPVSDTYRAEARQYLVAALKRVYVRFGVALPEWLASG